MTDSLGLPRKLLGSVLPGRMRSYLAGGGWVEDPSESFDAAAVYRHPAEPKARAIVPLDRELGDYAARVADLVRLVAAVEDRLESAVLHEIAAPDEAP